jgi:AraC-like DNA-binding protein
MGLLTERGVPDWHPAPKPLVEACKRAAEHCKAKGYPIEKLAMQFSCSNPRISSTVFSTTRPEAITTNIAYIEEPMDEQLVKDATCYVEDNLDNADISVETMAEALAMSRVHLYKKLTSLTDLTPSEFIRQIRLQHAEQLLRKSQLTVAEVAYRVGFNNPRYFSKYFKEMYGMMPSEYKNKVG